MAVHKHIILAAAMAAILIGCSSAPVKETPPPPADTYKYPANAALTSERVSSDDGLLMVQVPEGWTRASAEDTGTEIFLWLVNDDYSASITFMPIQMDPALYQALKRDGLSAVTKVSMSLKEGNTDHPMEIVQKPEPVTIGQRTFYTYEYTVNNKATVVRVAVFDTGSRFIECACVPAGEQTTPAVQRDLFRVQQTVLSSLEVR